MNLKEKNIPIEFILSDSIEYMQKYIQNESVQLVYLDPPLFSQKEQTQYNKDQEKSVSFCDKWKDKFEYDGNYSSFNNLDKEIKDFINEID